MRARPDHLRERPEDIALRDPLSDILDLVEARAVYAGGFRAGGAWAVRFPPPDKIKFFAIGQGAVQLAVDGLDGVFALAEGDVVVLSASVPFSMASDLAVTPADAREVFRDRSSGMVTIGAGDAALILGAHVDVGAGTGRALASSLPPVVHLAASPARTPDAPRDRLRWLIRELVGESTQAAPGAALARASLVHLLLLEALRHHLAQTSAVQVGWLRAACDPRLAPTLSLMHAEPARSWSLPELARAAHMSRTAFAHHFAETVGVPPLTYLTQWRMRIAERELRKDGRSVADVAHAVGYASEAAFSTAFKRETGRSPREVRG